MSQDGRTQTSLAQRNRRKIPALSTTGRHSHPITPAIDPLLTHR